MDTRIIPAWLALAAVLALAPRASAQNLYPLEEGLIWRYVGQIGSESLSQELRVIGPTTFQGAAVIRVDEILRSTGDLALDQTGQYYYSVENDGSVLAYGYDFTTPDNSGRWTYDPPVTILQPPLTVGSSWSVQWTETLSRDAVIVRSDSYSALYTVTGTETIVTPAGSYACVVVQRCTNPVARPAADSCVTQWFADGVGVVRTSADLSGLLLELDQFTQVGATSTTWSTLKSDYH